MIAPEYKVEIKDDAIQTQAGPGSDLYEPIKGKGLKVKKDKPETGLQKGDIVIKAFGQKLKGESAEEVSQALVESQNAPMILEVERKGKVVVLDLQIITLKKTEEKKKTNK